MSRTSALSLIVALVFAPVRPTQFGPAPPEHAATVISLTGHVSVMKGSVPWALKIGDTVQVRQLIITGSDGFVIFQVSDVSTFEGYPNSQVAFRHNFGNWQDIPDLWLERTREHIQGFGNQPTLNKIQTPTAVISVRG